MDAVNVYKLVKKASLFRNVKNPSKSMSMLKVRFIKIFNQLIIKIDSKIPSMTIIIS